MKTNKITIEELLFNDEPITINRKLAKCLGLKEAVIFATNSLLVKNK